MSANTAAHLPSSPESRKASHGAQFHSHHTEPEPPQLADSVADDGALGGFLDVTNTLGSLGAGSPVGANVVLTITSVAPLAQGAVGSIV